MSGGPTAHGGRWRVSAPQALGAVCLLKDLCAHSPRRVKRDTGPQVHPAGVRHTSFSGCSTPPKETTFSSHPRLEPLTSPDSELPALALFSGLTLKVSDMTSGLCCGSGSSYPSGVAASGRIHSTFINFLGVPTVILSLLKGGGENPGRRTSCQSEASPPTDAKLHSGTGDDKVRSSNDEVLITH